MSLSLSNYSWILEYINRSELRGAHVAEVGSRDALDAIWFSETFDATVDCFEASPRQAFKCRANVDAKHLSSKITVTELALSDSNEDIIFWEIDLEQYPNEGAGSMFQIDFSNRSETDVDRNKLRVQHPVTVKASRWDSLGLQVPRLVAMDVQGAEKVVLEGFGTALKGVELIVLEAELVPSYKGGVSASKLIKFLKSQGFKLEATRGVGIGEKSWRKYLVKSKLQTVMKQRTFFPGSIWQGQVDMLFRRIG